VQMVFPQGLSGPMVSPENLWILEISVKGSSREKQAVISKVEEQISSKSAATDSNLSPTMLRVPTLLHI